MEIQQLLGFIAVAETGSFSQAAQKTLRTQPAVSLQIKALEEEFRARLFDRLGAQRVIMTDEGELLYGFLKPIVGEIQQLNERFDEARNRLDRFQVHVASNNSAIMYLMPSVVKEFMKKCPKARLSIVNRRREDILAMVKNDEAQIGVSSISSRPAWAEYDVLGRFKRVLVFGKDHPLKKLRKIALQDISKYPLILPPPGSRTRQAIEQTFADNGLAYELALELLGREAVKGFIKTGLGISIMNEYFMTAETRQSMVLKDVSEYFGFSELGIITRRGRHLNRAATHFISLLHSEAARIDIS